MRRHWLGATIWTMAIVLMCAPACALHKHSQKSSFMGVVPKALTPEEKLRAVQAKDAAKMARFMKKWQESRFMEQGLGQPVLADEHGVIVSPPMLAFDANNNNKFSVALNWNPGAPLTCVIDNSKAHTKITLSKCEVTFDENSWNTPQEIQIVPVPTFGPLSGSFEVVVDCKEVKTVLSVQVNVGASGLCATFGDPHFRGPDNGPGWNHYKQGDQYMVYSKDANFVVQTRQRSCAAVSCNFGVAIKYYDTVVALTMSDAKNINGNPQDVLRQISPTRDPGFIVKKNSPTEYTFETPEGAKIVATIVWWYENYFMNVDITIPGLYRNNIVGECGNFNGTPGDDFLRRDGGQGNPGCATCDCNHEADSWCDTWTTRAGESLFDGGTVPVIESDAEPYDAANLTPNSCVPGVKFQCPAYTEADDILTILLSNENLRDSVATFVCKDGYAKSHPDTATCQTDGTWSKTAPTCTRQSCPALDNIENGQIALSEENW